MATASNKEKIFTQVFHDTKDKVYGFLLRYTDDHHLIEDIMQVCYVRIWEKMDDWKEKDKLLPLVKTVARNLLLNEIRNKARLPLEWMRDEDAVITEVDIIAIRKVLRSLDQAIDALPHQCRQVFLLHREEKLSYQEIADRLAISTHTVKNHMSKAIFLLRNHIPNAYFPALFIISAGLTHTTVQ